MRRNLVGVDALIDPRREAARGRRAADCRPYGHAPGFAVGAAFMAARAGLRFAEGLRESLLRSAAA